jgi:hypothetical protein
VNLDLQQFTTGWHCPPDEVCARIIHGRGGEAFVQLRVDLGVLQMFLDGRPDGERYHGHACALEYVQRERRARRAPKGADWQELQRELSQLNYRRLALCAIVEDADRRHHPEAAGPACARAARDIEDCLTILRLLEQQDESLRVSPALRATLLFCRARVLAKARILEQRIEEAIEAIERGVAELDEFLAGNGLDEETRQHDAGITLLRDMARNLRAEHSVGKTLREKLDEAVAAEDFEAAARLRDQLRRRSPDPQSGL